jgi:hypothetical protein
VPARLRSRLTYANVVSSLCLFVLLGGGAYAATRLPSNSVGPKQLKNNAVSTRKVKDRSLLAKDFKNGQLPRGAKGLKGDTGSPGKQGPGAQSIELTTGLTTGEVTVATVDGIQVKVSCGAGVDLDLVPLGTPSEVFTHGIQAFNGGTPTTVDDSAATFGGSSPTSFYFSVIARPGASQKWAHFELAGNRDGGNNQCTFSGLITPPS